MEPSREERFLRFLRLQKRLVGKNDDAAEAAFVAIHAKAMEVLSGRSAREIPELADAGLPEEHMFNLKSGLPRSGHGARRGPPREGETRLTSRARRKRWSSGRRPTRS